MANFKLRTAMLLGDEAMQKLASASVAIIGVGGVGAAAAEALVRSGIGRLLIVDHDTVDITNVNRQLIATSKNVGEKKTDAAKERFLAINPELDLVCGDFFLNEETLKRVFDFKPDFVIDAIDTVSSKLALALECQARKIALISSLGTGNRTDPTSFRLGKIEETAGCGCGLARVMRRECKKRGITALDVLYSTEIPQDIISEAANGRHSPASTPFCPPVAGYIIASETVKRIIAP